MPDAEVIVVGGGPAGSTVAAELAQAGHRVLLLDKAQFPRHKACSEYINPGGAALLREIGMFDQVVAAGAHQMTAMRVHAPDGGTFLADFERAQSGQAALGLSRYRLDQLLLERARAAGVEIIERAHVRDLLIANERVTGVSVSIAGQTQQLRAPLVIGADGRNSVVARSLGLAQPWRWPQKTGLVAHYRGVQGLDQFGEMHIADGWYSGLAPLEDGLTNVALVSTGQQVNARTGSLDAYFEARLRELPDVAWKLANAERVGSIRGVGQMACRARQVCGDGFLLVGDAAAFLDPFTGEGIYEALRAGLLAAPVASAALTAGDTSANALAPYKQARRLTFTAKRQVSWIVQGIINTPPIMNYVTPRLANRAGVGQTLSGVLGNFQPATRALSPLFLAKLLRP